MRISIPLSLYTFTHKSYPQTPLSTIMTTLSFPHMIHHLNIPHPDPALLAEPPIPVPHRLRHALPAPDHRPHGAEDDADAGEDAEHVARQAAGAAGRVEETVGVEALGGVGEVGEAEVEGEDEDQEGEVQGRWGVGVGEEDLDEGEEGV